MIDVNTDSAWKKLRNKIEESANGISFHRSMDTTHRRKSISLILQIAAVLVLTAGLSYVVFRTFVQPDRNYQKLTIRSDATHSSQSTLPDGSTVHLYTGSRIDFEQMESGIRQVYLKGEAYFNVSYSSDEPFVVLTDNAKISVLGTSFSVQDNPRNNQVKVFVESGHVLLSDKSEQQQSIEIEPGYIGIIAGNNIRKEENQNPNWLSWKTGKLVFRESRLEDVIRDLNHTFGTSIVQGDAKIAGCLFTGTFYNQPVDTLLDVLQTAFNLDVKRTRSQIILTGEGCE